MAKNITVQLHNAISGELELWASKSMTNGNRQTAPVFSQKVKITNGVATITGVQETPADKSWHYHAIIRPDWRKCGSSEGSAQFRFFVQASVPSTVSLVDLPSAWAWTQNGTNYAWLGTPNASQSVQVVAGKVAKTNYAINPSFETSGLNILTGSGGVSTQSNANPYIGNSCLQGTFAVAGTFKYIGQGAVIPAGHSYAKAAIAVRRIAGAKYSKLRIGWRDNPSTGAITYGPLTDGIEMGDDWKIVRVEQQIPSTAQYLVLLAYATDTLTGTTVESGTSWAIDALTLTLGSSRDTTPEPLYFDGNSLSE